MDEDRQLWATWARSFYHEPGVASAAAQAALAAIEQGSGPSTAALRGHAAAVDAGGEYRCRPNKTARGILVCILVAGVFIPAVLSGLSINPSPAGYIFLAIMGGGPVLGVVGLVLVRLNSCFFVTRDTVGRRNFLGRVVLSDHRSSSGRITVRRGSWTKALLTHEADDSEVQIDMPGVSSSRTVLYWWTDDRIREFAEVAGMLRSTY